jgi:hypothetical protein
MWRRVPPLIANRIAEALAAAADDDALFIGTSDSAGAVELVAGLSPPLSFVHAGRTPSSANGTRSHERCTVMIIARM